jgi:hypothetical protein
MKTIKNLQTLEVKYYYTNQGQSKASITDTRFNTKVIISNDYSNDFSTQVVDYIEAIGFNIIGRSCVKDRDFIMVDNFIDIKEMIRNV